MFGFFLTVTGSLNLAIDLGSGFYKSAFTIDSDLPQVSHNSHSKRVTPTFVAFRARPGFNASSPHSLTEDDSEFITAELGEKAFGVSQIRHKMVGGYFSALIGLTDFALKSKSSQFFVLPKPARVDLNNAAIISLGLYIQSIHQGKPIDHLTLIFPAFYTVYKRLVWEEGLKAINLTNYSEIDDVDAITVTYLIEKANNFKKQPQTVLFVDIGATSVKAYAVTFSIDSDQKPTAKRLSYVADRENGGAYITKVLSGLIRERITVSNTTEVEDQRLFAAAEKVKIELSAAEYSTVIVEIGGIDRSITINQSEFLGLVDPVVDAVVSVAVRASDGFQIDDVELIGGSSRLTIFQSALKKSLQRDSIRQSLDIDAAIAIGGAYATQFLLNQSTLTPLNLITPNSLHTITFVQSKYNITLCREGEPCQSQLQRPGLWGNFSLVYTRNSLTVDAEVLSHHYRIGLNSNGNVSFRFNQHPFKFIGYDKCNQTCLPGQFISETIPNLSAEIIHLLVDPNAKTERIKRLHAEVESYIDHILNEVSQNYTVRFFTNHTQRLEIIRCAERERKWIASPEAAKLSDHRNFTAHIRELKRCIAPVYRRIEENQTFYTEAERLLQVIVQSKNLLTHWRRRENPPDGAELFRFGEKLAKLETWFNETLRRWGSRKDFSRNLEIQPKVVIEKYTEFHHEMTKMKTKFGDLGPKLRRADGTPISGPEFDRWNDPEFMKSMGIDMTMDENLPIITRDDSESL